MGFPYRKDIDGLRAIAVTAVILFHLNPSFLPGGYLGVDLFFVISGFLITRLLAEQKEQGRFVVFQFYERRLRRLYPALLITIMISMCAAALLFETQKLKDFGGSALAALFGVSNFFFYLNTDYFGVNAEMRPLLHTWSLGVEEQFYLFWPFLLIFLTRISARLRLTILFALIILSIAVGEYEVRTNPDAAFFLLPSRVSELAIGGITAFLSRDTKLPERLGSLSTTIISFASFVVIFGCLIFYDHNTLFPGVAILPPSLATAALLFFPARTTFARCLSNPVIRWIGLVSYSAYLIHWPVIVFYKAYTLRSLTVAEEISIFFITFALASLSCVAIEKPFRRRSENGYRVNTTVFLSLFGTLVLTSTFLSVAAWREKAWIQLGRTDHIAEIETFRVEQKRSRRKEISSDGCHLFRDKDKNSDLSECLKTRPGQFNILVIGSSFAADDWMMLKAAYPSANVSKLTGQACLPIDADMANNPALPHCKRLYDEINQTTDRINAFDLVIISHTWSKNDDPTRLEPFFKKVTSPVAIFGPRGILNVSIMDILKKDGVQNVIHLDTKYIDEENYIARARLINFARAQNVAFIDMISIRETNGKIPVFAHKNQLIFSDIGHYTPIGARFISRQFKARYPSPDDIISSSVR